jgi:hypothetical protein
MILPYFSGFITGLFFKHKPSSAINTNVGITTTLVAMMLGFIWYQFNWLWIILANLSLFLVFRFWWKTDETKQWFIWGTYIAINMVTNLLVFGLIWNIFVKY